MRLAVLLAAYLVPATTFAAECRQENAVYADRDGGYEFVFEPSGSPATSHQFKVRVLASGATLDGIVMSGDEVARSNGMIMHDCPEGDVTGEEIAACTVWEGVLYGVSEAGAVDLLPEEGQAAAGHILAAGLGPSIRYSALWDAGKATVVPWDVIGFKECRG